MKFESIAIPALCTGLYKYPTRIVSRLLFDEIMHYSKHRKHDCTIKEIRLVDFHNNTVNWLAKEFDFRDFEDGSGNRKSLIEAQETLLGKDLKVTTT